MPLARLEPQAMRVDFTPACSRVNHSTARYPKLALLARWRHLISSEAKRGRSPSGRLPDGRITCAIAGADVRLACPFPPIDARLPPKRGAPKN
jgi:hypothetical protein